ARGLRGRCDCSAPHVGTRRPHHHASHGLTGPDCQLLGPTTPTKEDPLEGLARTRFRGPVLDARDAVELANFYASLLGWTVKDEYSGDGGSWALIESPSGDLKMEFQGTDDYTPPTWPNAAGEQQMMMHVDIAVEVQGGD